MKRYVFAKRQREEEAGGVKIERPRVEANEPGSYGNLNEHLSGMDFARQVWTFGGPAYCEERRGGPPEIDPVTYFKVLKVGFLENLRSERAIATRCEDSLSVRRF